MALKLSKQDQEFRNPLIFHGDAKMIDLDRVLLNLFMLIKYDGVRPRSRVGRTEVTPEMLVNYLKKEETKGHVDGFVGNEEKVQWWVMTNLVDLVNRGIPGKEAIASLKAIHLNSYKFRNPKQVRDYNIAEQVFAMLQESSDDLNKQLRSFLEDGWDRLTNTINKGKEIDLDTLGILRIVEYGSDDPAGDNQFRPPKCACPGQARIFIDDVRRLLAYRYIIPRHVLLSYLRTIIGLHVGLYLFKLFKMLPDWVIKGTRNSTCQNCPVQSNLSEPFSNCPYINSFIVDCGDDPDSAMAKLAEEDASYYFARIHDYIKATFSINMALQFSELRDRIRIEDIDIALEAIKNKGTRWNERFKLRIEDLISSLDDEQKEGFQGILDMGLPPFETFVEIVAQARGSFHLHYHRQMIDSLFQRNKETGLIWAGRSRKHGRRFWLSTRLLETLVQLSVLKVDINDSITPFYSEPILIENFLSWLQNRYGFIINGTNMVRFSNSDTSVHQAFKNNITNVKDRLREIGFFNVLSDAYIMQRIRPRYVIKK